MGAHADANDEPRHALCAAGMHAHLAGRPIGFGTWFCRGKGFWRTYARLGGEDRISTLLTIARFDDDHSGTISAEELASYQKFGEGLVNSTIGTFQTFSIVFTLLIGATHQTNISRPNSWGASDEFVADFGETAGDAMLVTAYALNALVEVLCIVTLLACIFLRFLLSNVLVRQHPAHPGRLADLAATPARKH